MLAFIVHTLDRNDVIIVSNDVFQFLLGGFIRRLVVVIAGAGLAAAILAGDIEGHIRRVLIFSKQPLSAVMVQLEAPSIRGLISKVVMNAFGLVLAHIRIGGNGNDAVVFICIFVEIGFANLNGLSS